MMQGMAVGQSGAGKTADSDDQVDVASDDDDDDDDEDDEDDADNDREGLQGRYQAALGDNDDSIMADASFAKYLHKQRNEE
ncbi:hypothetical protein G6O67_006274 [Ophiocordyceps sinensis]|nr:hypothetical protein G6O67_006274 [Ophiocordyceps sinensis]